MKNKSGINKTKSEKGGFLEAIGLGTPTYSLSDFEASLRNKYLINYALDLGLIIFGVVFSITTGYIRGTLLFFFVIIGAIGMHTYSLMQLLCGQVLYIEGICEEVERKATKVLWQTILGTSKVSILAEDGFTYRIPVAHSFRIKEGVKIRVYFTQETLFEKDEDTYEITNPIHVCRIKNRSDYL